MDQVRFEELKKKRYAGGLSNEEADELGRMFAEEQGEPYQGADDLRQQLAAEAAGEPAKEQPEEIAVEHRPETVVKEAEAQPASEQDTPAGTRAPLGARSQEARTEEK